jgi:NAD(P)-dependent dehydrogenase (short-subunit alcohol dehydrogenase family)
MGGRVEGLTAIVTGATEGIGLATARLLHKEGASLVLVARRTDPGRRLVTELGTDRARFVAGDVAEESTAKAAVGAALEHFGRLDVLVNNAAMDYMSDLMETSLEDVRRVLDVNVAGALLLMRESARAMKESAGGSIVNVTSRAAAVGIPRLAVYSAAKGALASLTRAAAIEWAPYRIRVNAVAPGATDTPLMRAAFERYPDPEARMQELAAQMPLGRMGRPEDVGAAILYLASPESAHVTGASIPVDGGYTAL